MIISVTWLQGCALINQQAHNESDWFARDKMVHFAGTTLISAAAATQAKNNGQGDCDAALVGITFTLSVGAGKEMYDKYRKKTMYSYRDMVWNGVGSLTGALLATGCH